MFQEKFSTLSCDLVPVTINLARASKKEATKFAIEIAQYICDKENAAETLEEFKNGEFERVSQELNDGKKYFSIYSKIANTIKLCPVAINEVMFRESLNEYWFITENFNEADYESFYNFVFDNWSGILSDVVILFIGEEQLDRKQLPTDIKSLIVMDRR